ncbi:MAG: hypothetical protein HOP29_18830 [Phycisphaerales bacterium]|nr:hypothetical protein [Phycisphaerales bacterium]
MERFSLISATVGLTFLVWAAADQLITETVELPAAITLRIDPAANMIVAPADASPPSFMIHLSGRQSDVSNLGDRASQRNVVLTVPDAVLQGLPLGEQDLPLLSILEQNPSKFPGCIVQGIEPPTFRVHVDRIVERNLNVVIRPGNLDYTVAPLVEPTSVQATIRQTFWSNIENANPRIALDAESLLKNQPEGRPIDLDVPLTKTVWSDVGEADLKTVSPPRVTLRATLAGRRETGVIQAVPVRFLVGDNVWKRYDVVYRQPNPSETLNVTVVGPPAEIARLKSGERKVFAFIPLGNPDAMAEFQFVKPEFNLPPGVELAEDGTLYNFEIRLQRRPDAVP